MNIPYWDNNVKLSIEWEVDVIFRLKELRKSRRISQVKMAMDLNMAQNTLSRYETGQREADYKTLILFADYFNVSLDYLLGRTNIPNAYHPGSDDRDSK